MNYEIEDTERMSLHETISHSDEEDGDDDGDDDYDDEDSTTETTSWFEDIRSSWRQHCVAIFIAILATAWAYLYGNSTVQRSSMVIVSSSSSQYHSGRGALSTSSSLHPQPLKPHEFLHRFERTANISFCGGSIAEQTFFVSDFGVMDFHVPKSLLHTVALYFQIDLLQEDDVTTSTSELYLTSLQSSSIFNRSTTGTSSTTSTDSHDQIQCLLRLKNHAPHDFIKGVTYFYKKPRIESMYRYRTEHRLDHSDDIQTTTKKNSPAIMEAVLTHTGFAAKFVNMGTTPILLYWDGRGGDDRNRRLVGEIAPFEALTTATRPGESFSVSPVYDHSLALDRWTLTADDAVQYYEPKQKKSLSEYEQVQYNMQMLNKEFAKHYLIHAGRTWLSHFPRAFPTHFMWKADYFGQHQEVEVMRNSENDAAQEVLHKYTLEVVSVTPRVFQIENFLSKLECETLIHIAVQNGLQASSVYAGGDTTGNTARHHRDISTRSSTNTWLTRDHHLNLTDAIYRRAAQLMKMDEAAFGHKAPMDDTVDDAKYHSIAESLQVVRYKVGEEYSPHHDWVLPSQLNRYQPTRFATLLIYLNDNFEGGQTVFPRAVNRQYHEGVTIVPRQGTAILFYNLLPDGNVDDLSQHGSEKVTKGEKVRFLTFFFME
jgi:prolyl 4-hydroxylase